MKLPVQWLLPVLLPLVALQATGAELGAWDVL